MIRVWRMVIWLCGLVAISGVGIGVVWGQDAPSSQIFPDSSCASPCWYSLNPLESTSQDVVDMLATNESAFFVEAYQGNIQVDPVGGEIPVLDTGVYALGWRTEWLHRGLGITQIPSLIYVEGGIVQTMEISVPSLLSVEDALDVLGTPDEVLYAPSLGILQLLLVYRDLGAAIGVYFNDFFSECSISELPTAFIVKSVHYFAPEFPAMLYAHSPVWDEAQSRFEQHIPVELWDSLMRYQGYGDCRAYMSGVVDALATFQVSENP